MLIVTLPDNFQNERKWICDVVFREFLGQTVDLQFSAVSSPDLTLRDQPGGLRLSDCFFTQARRHWLKPESLPAGPLRTVTCEQLGGLETDVDLPLPLLFSEVLDGQPVYSHDENVAHLTVDVLGSAFFMLSRYEEVARPQEDAHQRFPASASLAAKAGFLDRPIVDEYVEILWAAMTRVWPGLQRQAHQGRILVSCDVDIPFDPTFKRPLGFMRSLAGDCVKRRDPGVALGRIANYGRYWRGMDHDDTYNTFDWYLKVCDGAGLHAHFYFLAGKTHPQTDAEYNLSEPFITKLLRKIAQRGHGIGLHGSYMTFRDPTQLECERRNLERACRQVGLAFVIDTNRQHYLRWDTAQTPDHLESAGLKVDSTGGFADRAGFRYGTSRKFRMWSWSKNQGLALKQQPLIVMECSVIDTRYQNLGYADSALDFLLDLKGKALRYGDFTLLWHNSHFMHFEDKLMFNEIITTKS